MTRRRRLPVAAALTVVVALGLAGCSDETEPSSLTPSSAFPQDTGATGPTGPTTATGATGGATGPATTGATGPTSDLPSPPPGAGSDTITGGQAAITVTGDIQATKALTNLVSSVYAPPPGGMAIVWTAGGSDATTFGLGGLSFTGTQPTASTLLLTLTVQTADDISSFTSTAGECTVTIGVAGADQIAGVFTCSDLVGSGGEAIDASGSFAAQG